MSKKKTSGQMTENVNIQGDTEILLMDDDDCELNFDEDTGNGNDNAEFEHEEDTGNDNGDAEFEHEEDDPYTDDDDAEQTLGNSDENSYDVPDYYNEVAEYFSDDVELRMFLHSAAFQEFVAVHELSQEMNKVVRGIRNKFLEYVAIYEASDSDGIDATEMIKNLNRIDVYSALDRANSIIQLMREFADHRMQVS